jgi:hypothetical protein
VGLGSEVGKALLPILFQELGRRKGKKVNEHFGMLFGYYDAIKALGDRINLAAASDAELTLTKEEVVLLDKLCDEVESISLRLRK